MPLLGPVDAQSCHLSPWIQLPLGGLRYWPVTLVATAVWCLWGLVLRVGLPLLAHLEDNCLGSRLPPECYSPGGYYDALAVRQGRLGEWQALLSTASPVGGCVLLLIGLIVGIFFHEYGRRVGGVPRSSMKGKETQHDEGGKEHKQPQTPTNHQPNKNPKHKGQRPNPPHLKVFPLYEGETGEKSWL